MVLVSSWLRTKAFKHWKKTSIGVHALLFLSTFEIHVYLTIAANVSFVIAETTEQKRVDIRQGSWCSRIVLLQQLGRVSSHMGTLMHKLVYVLCVSIHVTVVSIL